LLRDSAYHRGLRNWCLRWGTTLSEDHANLLGDDLFGLCGTGGTGDPCDHDSRVRQDRSGFYSYTILENMIGADMPKVERRVPEWKPRAVGGNRLVCHAEAI
jgi:hypothetical protein